MQSRILVVGVKGFVGRSVEKTLLERDHTVVGLGGPGSGADIELDLADRKLDMHALARRVGPVAGVIHLAAKISRTSCVDRAARSNLITIAESPVRMLEAFHAAHGPTHFVYCSSIKLYGPSERPIDPLGGPFRPEAFSYGSAKLLSERLLAVSARRLGAGCAWVRPSFIYGPEQRATNAIPIFMSACLRGESPVLFGAGKELRDDVLVSDVAYCLVEACLRRQSGPFNATGECARTLLEVAEAACRAVEDAGGPAGIKPRVDSSRTPKAWIDQRFELERSRRLLGYEPTPLAVGLLAQARALVAGPRASAGSSQ
jgi:UDP-glucose 4-epimerase